MRVKELHGVCACPRASWEGTCRVCPEAWKEDCGELSLPMAGKDLAVPPWTPAPELPGQPQLQPLASLQAGSGPSVTAAACPDIQFMGLMAASKGDQFSLLLAS